MDRIYLDNDHVVRLEGLKDDAGNAVTSATVECRVLDKDKAEVGGITWPVTLNHTGSGNYEAQLDKAVQITDGQLHYLEVTAVSGSIDATWRTKLYAEERDS